MIDFNAENVVIPQIGQVDHFDRIDIVLTVNGKLLRMPLNRLIEQIASDRR